MMTRSIEAGSRVRTTTGDLGTVRSVDAPNVDGITYAYVDLDDEKRTPDGVPYDVRHLELMP